LLKKTVGSIHGKAIFGRRIEVLSSMIRRLLPPNAHVLDVGTGNGQMASMWQTSGVSVEGIDVFVRDETYIPVRPFDGRTIPAADNSTDVVTFVDVLHHTDDAQILLNEAARVARHSVIIKDHLAENSLDHATLRLMDWVGNAPHGVVLPYNYFSKQQWDEHFQRAGLKEKSFNKDVPLYPAPLSVIFVRKLHFVAQLLPQ
jgi:SAM-dependent methyltransferase